MQELKLIESGLIKVYETEKSEKVVDGRELHEGLESKRQFADWIKQRLLEVDAVENEDYISLSQKCEGNNATRIDYILKLNIAKEMAMLERNEKGKQYRRYLIEVEEKYKSNPFVYRHLKNTFQVNSYRNIATVDFDKAIKAINDWKPCRDIELMIVGANSRAV